MELWKALAQLYPDADPRSDYMIVQEAGGEPTIAAWNLPGPQPTSAQLAAAVTAYDAQHATQANEAATNKALVRATAEGAVGVKVDTLTLPQLRALVALWLHERGAIDATLKVKPLGEWAD
jgi:hypothetical protein